MPAMATKTRNPETVIEDASTEDMTIIPARSSSFFNDASNESRIAWYVWQTRYKGDVKKQKKKKPEQTLRAYTEETMPIWYYSQHRWCV